LRSVIRAGLGRPRPWTALAPTVVEGYFYHPPAPPIASQRVPSTAPVRGMSGVLDAYTTAVARIDAGRKEA
jgi:hypothetical protein